MGKTVRKHNLTENEFKKIMRDRRNTLRGKGKPNGKKRLDEREYYEDDEC
jgi:hypothetical protein